MSHQTTATGRGDHGHQQHHRDPAANPVAQPVRRAERLLRDGLGLGRLGLGGLGGLGWGSGSGLVGSGSGLLPLGPVAR
jgi:hypothetical protein